MMSNQAWDAVVANTVLGTERQAAILPKAAGMVGALLENIDRSNNERMLLSAAAILSAFQRAAWYPRNISTNQVVPADTDTKPICSAQAAQHLQAMLGGSQRESLGEWLTLLDQVGQRIPTAQLPEILEIGRGNTRLRPVIRYAIGVRGIWLAEQHHEWNYVTAHNSALPSDWDALVQLWETSPHQQRLHMLETLRSTYAEPARALVELTWASEKADHRAAFLNLFEHNLSMADEPFLETALDDRSKEVRSTAVDLLARLPDSRLVQRMIGRIETLLRWEPPEKARLFGLQRGRPGALSISLPEQCDKAMIRDGVKPKPVLQQQKMGERAQWFLQILRTIPPSFWLKRFQSSPNELLAAASHSEWRTLLEAAWIYASQNYNDQVWAEALLRNDSSSTALLTILPNERQELLMLDLLTKDTTPLATHAALGLLLATTHTWSVELSHSVLDALRSQIRRNRQPNDYRLFGALDHFAKSLPPKLALGILNSWPPNIIADQHWQGVIDRMLVTLHFRADMQQALGIGNIL